MKNVFAGGEKKSFQKSFFCMLWKFWFDVLSCFRSFAAFVLGGEKCLRCGSTRNPLPLCAECRKKILSDRPQYNRCEICGKVLISQARLCTYCRESPVLKSVDDSFPIETYQIWKKELLFSWKSEGERALSRFFADWIFSRLDADLPIVPVPPRPGKIRKKGWDQINEVCFYLEKERGCTVLPLLRRRGRTQQKKLGMSERIETIGKNYYAKEDKEFERICGKIGGVPKEVLLIDDVMTTGSTLENCAEVLKEKGVEKIKAVTLFGV